MSGATTTWGIAQLTTPSDSIHAPQIVIPDWQRGLLYYLTSGASVGGMRRYAWALQTQSPQLSVPASTGFMDGFGLCADIDPVSGNIIAQNDSAGLNGQQVHKYDHTTFAVLASYGASTSNPVYPAAFFAGQQIVCVQCAGVGYAILKEAGFSAAFDVLRVSDSLIHAGFQGHLSGAFDNRCIMTRGASGTAGGSIFATWQNIGQTASVPLYTIRIAPGAETYNPASWPTTNPHISEQTIGTIAAAAIDPAWATLQVDSIGYDAGDGNVLMRVSGPSGAAHPTYLVKASGTTAAVLWSVAVAGDLPQLWSYNVHGGEAGFLGAAHKDAVSMASGAITTLPLSGVTLAAFGPASDTAFWDGQTGLYFVHAGYTQAAGTPAPVSGTPSTFTDFAIMGIVGQIPPPNGGGGATTAKLALLRQPLLSFIGPPQ